MYYQYQYDTHQLHVYFNKISIQYYENISGYTENKILINQSLPQSLSSALTEMPITEKFVLYSSNL